MSKARAKGTEGENEVVDILVEAGFPRADPEDPLSFGVKRFEGGYESHDIQGVGPWVIEVKFRRAWRLFEWIRKIRQRSVLSTQAEKPWVIFAIHGDRRTREGKMVGAVAIMDAKRAAELIAFWEGWHNVGHNQ